MIFDSIKRNFFAVTICCLTIIFLLWGGNLLFSNKAIIPAISGKAMPLMQLLAYWFYDNVGTAISIGAVIVLLIAALFYRLNVTHMFISKREPLLPIIFVLLMSAFSNTHYILGIHIALFLCILSMNSIFQTYRRDYAFQEVFMGAFYLSVATLFYAPVIYFIVGLIICLSLMKPVLWRDVVVVIAGMIVPYVFALFYYFFTLGDWQIPFLLFAKNIRINFPLIFPTYTATEWIYVLYIAIITFAAILRLLFIPAAGNKIKTIRINILFGWLFFVALFCYIFYPAQQGYDNLLLMGLPVAVLITNLFGSIKNNAWANTLFIFLLLSILAIQVPDWWFVNIGDTFTSVWKFIIGLF